MYEMINHVSTTQHMILTWERGVGEQLRNDTTWENTRDFHKFSSTTFLLAHNLLSLKFSMLCCADAENDKSFDKCEINACIPVHAFGSYISNQKNYEVIMWIDDERDVNGKMIYIAVILSQCHFLPSLPRKLHTAA